ncbi:MAG: bacillithiol transferase BstA [Acidobacteria bacterium]|nr:bacillithiol transferase BstA [Acidobacteriota bacterium]
MTNSNDPRYPIGQFTWPEAITPADRRKLLNALAATPELLRAAVEGLTPAQLETPYRPGGWTIRQTVHHVADSHINAYLRCRFALTEDAPVIKPYAEELWAELSDAATAEVDISLLLLTALHMRWVLLLESLTEAQWQRTFVHPVLGPRRLEETLALYAWHGTHHIAHITNAPF